MMPALSWIFDICFYSDELNSITMSSQTSSHEPFVRAEGTPCLHELHFGAGMSNEMTKEKRDDLSGIWSNFCILGVKTELAENSEFSFRNRA